MLNDSVELTIILSSRYDNTADDDNQLNVHW